MMLKNICPQCGYSTPETQDWLGEDMIFCQKIAQAGHTIKIDTQLSMELHHLGTFAFNSDVLD